MRQPRSIFAVLVLILAVALAGPPAVAGQGAGSREGSEAAVVAVDRWLVAGPTAAPWPAFAAETGVGRRDALEAAALLPDWPWQAGEPWPAAGMAFPWPGAEALGWSERREEELRLGEEGAAAAPRLAWIATYVEADRFTEARLTVTTPHRVRVFFDGEAVATKTVVENGEGPAEEPGEVAGSGEGGSEQAGGERKPVAGTAAVVPEAPGARAVKPGSVTAELVLRDGKHLVVLAALYAPGEEPAGVAPGPTEDDGAPPPWTLSATLTVAAGEDGAPGEGGAAQREAGGAVASEGGTLDEPGTADEETGGAASAVRVSSSPERGLRIGDLLDPPNVATLDLSADGTLVAVTLEQPAVPSEDRSTWVEILRAADGAPVRTLRGSDAVRGFSWAPVGHRFAYRTSRDGKATLWVGAAGPGGSAARAAGSAASTLHPVLRDVENVASHRWAPDGETLFVEITEEPPKDERGAVRVRSLADRLPGARDLASVHQVSAIDGRGRRLTAGPLSSSIEDVSPDGRRLLVARTRFDLETPFSYGELIEIDLETLEPVLLAEVTWLGGASYSPDGARLLVTAGPSAFGELGLEEGLRLPGGSSSAPPAGAAAAAIPNEYDGQAYLVDLAAARRAGRSLAGTSPEDEDDEDDEAAAAPPRRRHPLPDSAVTPLTRGFAPAVGTAAWSHADGAIYLATTEGAYGPLYRWEPGASGAGTFRRVETGPEVLSSLSVAREAPVVAYSGSSAQTAEAVWVQSRQGAARRLLAPSADLLAQVRFGRVEDFDVSLPDGSVLPGRLYYPLDFDPAKRYPLLTYYYGGVVPTDRSFGGRYPKNWWAAHGYAVYVPQPSGAVGWGQARSALHVNDWGERVVEEVLAGVDAVLAAHPFLDPERVGCFGGSYGGFLTMRLVTESDRFAAAISHAGISGIASYWGEGFWGYLYMATAASGSYPWNRPDLFVERSPLFQADEVTTPLLLLHGTADPNVPPGESDQMFAALRILGKEVEYVRIEGEAHWILTYPKRVLWWRTIVAWFDRHLKGQPEAWEHLWGEDLDRGGP